MVAPLRHALVHRPGAAFGAAYADAVHGLLHPVDLAVAQREHDAFVELLVRLGVQVHILKLEPATPDLVYTFDPLLVTDRGTISLRPASRPGSASPHCRRRGRAPRGSRPSAHRGSRLMQVAAWCCRK